MPNLQCATFNTRFKYELNASTPRDFSPMGRAPKLRELHVVNCPPVDLEVAALNAMLPPWNDVFLAPQPRPLPPKLRIIIAPHTKHPGGRGIQPDPADNGLPDAGLRECEGRWIGRFVENNISDKLGCSDWGHVTGNGLYRTFEVTIESYGVVEKFREIIEAARASLTRLPQDYEAHIHIWLKVPKRKPSPAEQELIEKFEKEQDEADFERRHREQEALRERLHEYELKKQLGEPVKPEEFAPGEREPLPPPPWEEDEDDEDEDDAGDDGGGDLAVKQKPEPPPMWYDKRASVGRPIQPHGAPDAGRNLVLLARPQPGHLPHGPPARQGNPGGKERGVRHERVLTPLATPKSDEGGSRQGAKFLTRLEPVGI